MTNFEKIKQMTVEEFAEFLENTIDGAGCECCIFNESCTPPYNTFKCVKGRINWLNQEVEEC